MEAGRRGEEDDPPVSGWQTVLDEQLALFKFWRSEMGYRVGNTFGESMRRVSEETHDINESAPALTRNIAAIEASKMFKCDPVYVEDDMMTVIETAAKTFQPEALYATDLITNYGFVVLPRCMTMVDRHETSVTFRAFSWMPVEFKGMKAGVITPDPDRLSSGVHLSLYTHIDDALSEMDGFSEQVNDQGWTPEKLREAHSRMGSPYMLTHVTPWAFGQDVPEGMEWRYAHSWWKPIQSFFRLTLQTIGDRYTQRPPRASHKRWKRETEQPEDRYITVIRLRRPRHDKKEEGEPVNWTHRWIVGGHWRNQWYPSLGFHRQIWIGDYVKGPDDKPLLVRKGRAFELVR